jgi:hypothetical protein
MFNSMLPKKGTSVKFLRNPAEPVRRLKAHDEYVQLIKKPGAP